MPGPERPGAILKNLALALGEGVLAWVDAKISQTQTRSSSLEELPESSKYQKKIQTKWL